MTIFFLFLFYWLGLSFRYAYIPIALVALILVVVVFKKYKIKLFLLSLSLFAIGIGVSYIRFDYKRESFSGMVIDAKDNYFILLSKGERLYAYEKNNSYEIGDYITIQGEKKKMDFATLESQFDFNDYLEKKGVNYQITIDKEETKFSNPLRFKTLRKKFLDHFDEDTQSLVKALMFSSKDGSDDIYNMKKLHILRLASASGIFLYAYIKFINFIVSIIRKKKEQSVIPLLILFPYLLITFPRFTVIRIFIIQLFSLIFHKKTLNTPTKYGVTGLFFLLFDYHIAYDTSFIMGYTLPIIVSFINDAIYKHRGIKKKIIFSLLIYLAVVPFELQFYQGINPLSIFLITSLTPLFIVLAFLSLISLYGLPIYSVVGFFAKIAGKILGFLSKFAFQINAPPMNGITIIVFVLLFLTFLYYKSIDFIPLSRAFSIIVVGFIGLYCLPIENWITTAVYFINVGQGDSCLVRKGNTAVMIDTGGLQNIDIAKEVLIPFLQKEKIYDIDVLITTHDDFDHNGGMDSLIENYYVKDVVTEATKFPLSIGGITFTNYNNHIGSMSGDNDNSLVVGFEVGGSSYLVMGDAPIEVERNIMREYETIPCDILKVGHHGSNTSTCDDFVKYLRPKEAVISCGKNNKYGHPKQSVLDTLNRNGVSIRRTDREGTIFYKKLIINNVTYKACATFFQRRNV